jgi:hypothetical protein
MEWQTIVVWLIVGSVVIVGAGGLFLKLLASNRRKR